MNLYQKITQTFLLTILTVSFLGCTSEEIKVEPAQSPIGHVNQTIVSTPLSIPIENKIVEELPSQTVLRFKVKPAFVDVHDQTGTKLGTSDAKGVIEFKVDSGNESTYYFKKKGYSKKSIQIGANGEMHISYLRLDSLIPALTLAEAGDAQAQLLVGDMYFEGTNGVDQSLSTANYFYTLSAEAGNLESKARLCAILQQDDSLGDRNESIKYCKEAAAQNNATALFFLGMLYKKNTVVDKNLDTAKEYFKKAVKLGLEEAQQELDLMQ